MKDAEIKKALGCCILSDCENCPHDEETACKENLNQEIFDLINRQQAEIEKLKDSRDRWKRNALSFDEASRETEKELEKLYAEIEEHKNKCDKCGAKTRACIESLQNNIAEKQAEIERLQSVLLCFIDEVSKWENKHGLDVSELPLIPIKGESEKITSQIKSEAINKFAERLKEHAYRLPTSFFEIKAVNESWIDAILKEMVGDAQ